MSYDITLTADAGGRTRAPIAGAEWNFTSNIYPMLSAAGVRLNHWDGQSAGACAGELRRAIEQLTNAHDHVRTLQPVNGWGTYDQMMPALEKLLDILQRWPGAQVEVYG
jgi:hypothetical protein